MGHSKIQTNAKIAPELEHPDEVQRNGISFLDLPRELRAMIYKYIPDNHGAFSYDIRMNRSRPHWLPSTVGSHMNGNLFDEKYGNPGVALGNGAHCFAILLTCRTIYSEALPILYASTPLGVWRPMYDYGGSTKYPDFVAKVFNSLPVHASQYIRTLQLQGEFFHRSMQTLLTSAIIKLPSWRILEIGLDPHYEDHTRKHWFDGRGARQSWPAFATLHSVAQHLDSISITVSPPEDGVHTRILSSTQPNSVSISGTAYRQFLWLQLQLLVMRIELTIYGALLNGDFKSGMEFFMDTLLERENLFEIFQRSKLIDECIAGTAKFRLEDQKDWLRGITGRTFEVDEKERRVNVISERKAEMKWCKVTYTSAPRGQCMVDEGDAL
ncbi:uncharacterized protein M437DRAFT_75602 [Aureobasidium melanogenum CBS 110374]|uniref:DUF7730 domain-containing protein n=1 Tax=Aureobasidium melanogenum (strain CBS 110374) TaxID=1043003 RepID=A0A074VXM1_AURM1|nr:uncharacterized protein M437DRAFT_75602 [Aureobasidium melanogenum CBS 110374]KEQ62462.1 hypothetical protein M437DRAFT_75602 [Aureobasidium melanogenum CBS 110374]